MYVLNHTLDVGAQIESSTGSTCIHSAHRKHIHAVDLDTRHIVAARIVVIVRRRALLTSAHAVLVVLAHIPARKLSAYYCLLRTHLPARTNPNLHVDQALTRMPNHFSAKPTHTSGSFHSAAMLSASKSCPCVYARGECVRHVCERAHSRRVTPRVLRDAYARVCTFKRVVDVFPFRPMKIFRNMLRV